MKKVFLFITVLWSATVMAITLQGRDSVITDRMQQLIDSVAQLRNGGTIVLSPGVYCVGTINLKSNVHLHMEKGATLLGSINPYDYPGYVDKGAANKDSKHFALITADNARNISITGEGTIDGRGLELALAIDSLHHTGERIDQTYNIKRMRPGLRPKLFELVKVDSLTIKNVNLRASASWGLSMNKCSNVLIEGIDFVNRAYWNNDGIDMLDCHNVTVTGCNIDAADDGICLKSTDPDDYNSNITITNNNIANSASAIKFGTESFGGFKDVTIINNKVRDTYRSAIAIESVDGAIIENVVVDSIEAVNTGNAFFIRLGHRNGKRPGSIKNVTISNLTCEVPFG